MQEAFDQVRRAGARSFSQASYRMAGRVVRMRLAGSRLAPLLTQPFEHLRIPGCETARADLTIDAWDESETGVPCPRDCLPGRIKPIVRSRNTGRVLGVSPDGRFLIDWRPGLLAWFDLRASHLITWHSSPDARPRDDRIRPFRLLLQAWAGLHDVQLIHAGFVARDGQGALLLGASGAGKSTSSLACLCAGFAYLGDDVIGLQELADGSFVGHSLFASGKLDRRHAERFPMLRGYGVLTPDRSGEGVLQFQLPRRFPDRLVSAAPVRVLLLPRVVDAETSGIRPASQSQALLAVAPETLKKPMNAGREGFEQLTRLVARVPSYWLELGRDIGSIPIAVEAALRDAAE
jgi:hypothetical protein